MLLLVSLPLLSYTINEVFTDNDFRLIIKLLVSDKSFKRPKMRCKELTVNSHFFILISKPPFFLIQLIALYYSDI